MQILPAINCPDFACAKERIRKAEAFAEWIHVDVVDGKFAPPVTWGNPEEFASLTTPLKLEVHLMVEDPEGALDAWLRAGAKRVVVHLESLKDHVYVLEKCKKFGAEVFLGINPGTEAERAFAHAGDFQGFLVLAVFPGYSGQPRRASKPPEPTSSSRHLTFFPQATPQTPTMPYPRSDMELHDKKLKFLEEMANVIRQDIIAMLVEAKSGHSAGPLGMADIFTALYFHVLPHDPKRPDWPERDRLVLSNGHICPVRYVAMAHAGYFPVEELKTLRKLNSRLQGHPHRTALPG